MSYSLFWTGSCSGLFGLRLCQLVQKIFELTALLLPGAVLVCCPFVILSEGTPEVGRLTGLGMCGGGGVVIYSDLAEVLVF